MKKLHSRISLFATLASVLSALFAAAIPLLCVTAGKNVALMVISIVVLGVGVLALPFLWVEFGLLLSLRGITALIENEKIYLLTELAERLHISPRRARRRVRRLLRYGILSGFFFDGTLVHPAYRLGERI